jgi:hypothetical protein
MGMRDDKKPRTRTFRLSFSEGGRSDSDPIVAPVLRTSNVVLSPDGTEAGPREGATIYKNYEVEDTSPVGRKAILVDRYPFNTERTMHMIIATRLGSLEKIHFSREAVGGNGLAELYFGNEEDTVEWSAILGPTKQLDIVVGRRGNLDSSATGKIYLIVEGLPNSDIADVISDDPIVQFDPGEVNKTKSFVITPDPATPPAQYDIHIGLSAVSPETTVSSEANSMVIHFAVGA